MVIPKRFRNLITRQRRIKRQKGPRFQAESVRAMTFKARIGAVKGVLSRRYAADETHNLLRTGKPLPHQPAKTLRR